MTHPVPSPLDAHVGYWLRFVSNHVSHGFRRKVEACGVTVAEWVALRELYGLGRTSPCALVAAMGMTKGAVSKLVDRLVGKGLATREARADDRRAHELELTAVGRALVPRLAELADANDRACFGHMPRAARDELVRTLRQLALHHDWTTVPVD